MARGNDHDGNRATLSKLADDFGRGVGNADDLIQANLERHSVALRAAEHLPRHAEKTEAAQKKFVGKKLDGNQIIDAAVRGDTTCAVVEDSEGRRWVVALDDHGDVDDEPVPVPFTAPPMDPRDPRRKNEGQPAAPPTPENPGSPKTPAPDPKK